MVRMRVERPGSAKLAWPCVRQRATSPRRHAVAPPATLIAPSGADVVAPCARDPRPGSSASVAPSRWRFGAPPSTAASRRRPPDGSRDVADAAREPDPDDARRPPERQRHRAGATRAARTRRAAPGGGRRRGSSRRRAARPSRAASALSEHVRAVAPPVRRGVDPLVADPGPPVEPGQPRVPDRDDPVAHAGARDRAREPGAVQLARRGPWPPLIVTAGAAVTNTSRPLVGGGDRRRRRTRWTGRRRLARGGVARRPRPRRRCHSRRLRRRGRS